MCPQRVILPAGAWARHYWASVHLLPASKEAGTLSQSGFHPPSDPEHNPPDDQGLCLHPLTSRQALNKNCPGHFA